MANVSSLLLKTARKAVKKVNPTKVVATANKSRVANRAEDAALDRKVRHMKTIKNAAALGALTATTIDHFMDESKKNKQNILKNKKNAAKVKANTAKVKANAAASKAKRK